MVRVGAYLVATRELAGVYTLPLLRLADAVGSGSIGDIHRSASQWATAHVLAADHG